MDRSRIKNIDRGFTLLELLIAIVLSVIILLSAANLLISYARFSVNVVKSEASLMGTTMGTFEGIVKAITEANQVAIGSEANMDSPSPGGTPFPAGCAGASCIQIRLDTVQPAGCAPADCVYTPLNHDDDTIHTYYLVGSQLKYRTRIGAAAESGEATVSDDITSLSFTRLDNNRITVILEAQTASGSIGDAAMNKSKEHLETTAVMRAGSGN